MVSTGSTTGAGSSAVTVVGRSCHSRAEVARAGEEGFDYAMLSPYALTESKPGYGPPLGPDAFRDLPIPTYALGGITPDNAADAVAAGAHGVAVMGAVMRAEEPAQVVAALLAAIDSAVPDSAVPDSAVPDSAVSGSAGG